MLTLTGRLQSLADRVAGLGLGVALHIETTPSEINWRLTATDPLTVSPVNASGTQKSEALAIRDIIAAAHEQLWAGVNLEIGEAAEAELFDDAPAFPEPEETSAAASIPDEMDDEEREAIVSGFVDVLKGGKSAAEDTFRQMAAEDRVKLFPILNGELSRLNNQEALLGKTIPRKSDVESLIGILARVGEA